MTDSFWGYRRLCTAGERAFAGTKILSRTVAISCAALLAGCIAAPQPPKIEVSIAQHGTSPQDVERLLIKPMEAELATLKRLKELNSVARPGHAIITLLFEPNYDRQAATASVRRRVRETKAKLPPGADEPKVADVTEQTQ